MILSKKQLNGIAKITLSLNIELLYLFGSQARGDATKNSDFDIAYLSKEKLNQTKLFLLRQKLAVLFNTSSQKIDLININYASPLLSYQISQEGFLLFGKPSVEDAFYRLSVMRYIDAKPLFQASQKYIKSNINV